MYVHSAKNYIYTDKIVLGEVCVTAPIISFLSDNKKKIIIIIRVILAVPVS